MYETPAQNPTTTSVFSHSKERQLVRPKLRETGFLRETIELFTLVLAIYTLVNLASVRFIVQGPSMQPNFETGQFLVVSRASYLFSEPQRGDIVVFHYPGDPEEDYIKRLIGLPGDTVEIREQVVYVNDVALVEPYINEACNPSRCRDNAWTLGADDYFFMGDNRNHSSDSRSFGPVNREYIVGKVIARYWPLSDLGVLLDE